MKKTALSLSVLLGLLAATLAGCDSVKPKKDDGKEVIFTVDGTNVTADDILGFDDDATKLSYDFLNTDEGTKAIYEAIYNALAQKSIPVTDTMKAEVKEKMEDFKENYKSYASTNGITENSAKKEKLEELGFETEKELEAYYLIEIQKDKLEEKFKDEYLEPKNVEDTGTLLQQYVTDTAPLIVRHILVKVSDSNTIHKLASIKTGEVDTLVSVLQRLTLSDGIAANSFKQVAIDESGDGSNTNGGNVGIVDKYTNFVSEFKFGLYQHLSEEGKLTTDTALIPDEVKSELEAVYSDGIKTIDVVALGSVLAYVYNDNAKAEQEAAGHTKVSEYDSNLYPRNVLYNYYLNTPEVKYLEFDLTDIDTRIADILKVCYPSLKAAEKASDLSAKVTAIKDSDYYKAFTEKEANVSKDANGIIVDENEEKIVVAKSSYGFHFMTITHDSHDDLGWKYFTTGALTDDTYYYKAETYDFGYENHNIASSARKTEVKDRILNYIKGGYNTITPTESLYEYAMLEKFQSIVGLDIEDKFETKVNEFINNQKQLKQYTIDDTYVNDWTTYIDAIEATNEMHAMRYGN